MKALEIHNQAEYNANKDFDGLLIIKGNAMVEASDNATVRASDNATVEASGNATVRAWGNAMVEASGNAMVRASDNATVEASGNATVRAWGNAMVEASGNATVEAWGNATVRAWGNAMVEASDNATVRASGNATVRAWDNATVRASGNATVEASDNATVRAWDNAHCLLLSSAARFTGIQNATSKVWVKPVYDAATLDFVADHEDGRLILYKSVNLETSCDFKTGKIEYRIGETVECPDWDPNPRRQCGGGLHLCTSALKMQDFNVGKILKCLVDPADVVVYAEDMSKVRCRHVRPVAVVGRDGKEIVE